MIFCFNLFKIDCAQVQRCFDRCNHRMLENIDIHTEDDENVKLGKVIFGSVDFLLKCFELNEMKNQINYYFHFVYVKIVDILVIYLKI